MASFQADATEGLHHMHSVTIIHCDQQFDNTLIRRPDGPKGFVGKVTDPTQWCDGWGQSLCP